MVTEVLDWAKVTVLSLEVRDTLKDLVSSTTSSPMMDIITVRVSVLALNVSSVDTVV